MTTGTILTGVTSPYGSGYYKTWSGGDSFPDRKKWNHYEMASVSRIVSGHYPMGIEMPSQSFFTPDDELRLLDKLASVAKRHEFRAGVFLGQAGETARTISGTATAFKGIAQSLKRRDLQGALRFLTRSVGGSDLKAARRKLNTGDLAGAHLSLVYGWLPLLSDVKAACDALEVLANPPRRSSITVSRNRSGDQDGSQSPSLYSCIGRRRSSVQIIYRMEEELSQARSLGLLDPASVVWELVPYSFVVDWFVPIGTYLSNLAVIPFLRGEFLVTSREKWAAQCIVKPESESVYGGGSSAIETRLSRHPTSGLSVPLPTFRGFASLYNSSQRTTNAIALMRNLYKGTKLG